MAKNIKITFILYSLWNLDILRSIFPDIYLNVSTIQALSSFGLPSYSLSFPTNTHFLFHYWTSRQKVFVHRDSMETISETTISISHIILWCTHISHQLTGYILFVSTCQSFECYHWSSHSYSSVSIRLEYIHIWSVLLANYPIFWPWTPATCHTSLGYLCIICDHTYICLLSFSFLVLSKISFPLST